MCKGWKWDFLLECVDQKVNIRKDLYEENVIQVSIQFSVILKLDIFTLIMVLCISFVEMLCA